MLQLHFLKCESSRKRAIELRVVADKCTTLLSLLFSMASWYTKTLPKFYCCCFWCFVLGCRKSSLRIQLVVVHLFSCYTSRRRSCATVGRNCLRSITPPRLKYLSMVLYGHLSLNHPCLCPSDIISTHEIAYQGIHNCF